MPFSSLRARAARLVPGVALSVSVAAVAYGLQHGEVRLFGKAWLESLVLAILIGAMVRSIWTPSQRWSAGISFSAKFLLEVAVVLLGASVSVRTLLAVGPALLIGVVATVVVAIASSFVIGRLLRLPMRMALLVACGNSICGNSAIAAVAPVIGAHGDDVAASIGFTAVLGIAVVLGLPLFAVLLSMGQLQYGVLVGLTVYAVPQVIAAAAPMGATAVQIGTLIKLIRVMMLGPVCLVLFFVAKRFRDVSGQLSTRNSGHSASKWPPLHRLIPWFIGGFLLLVGIRAIDLFPLGAIGPIGELSTILTVISMAGLGLGVDVRVVARAGARVTAAVTLSLLILGLISLGLIHAVAPREGGRRSRGNSLLSERNWNTAAGAHSPQLTRGPYLLLEVSRT